MCDNNEKNVILDDIPVSEVPTDLIRDEDTKDPIETEKKITEDTKLNGGLFEKSYMEMDEKFIEYLSVFTKAIEKSEELKSSLKNVSSQ